ncbi:MAG: class I tRNA ligase family protein [Vicinamibacteria bacterium]|nr:class I tRNA ligase family protein [Vicinamibacteria bacterium]
MRLSEEIFNRLSEAYRKIRNTCRYLLSNLSDFDPARDARPAADLDEIDRYALSRHNQFVKRVKDAYQSFEFHLVYHQLVQYCAVDLSSFYCDVLKDRLYCDALDSQRRRASQTVLHRILKDLTLVMAPVLPVTADEVWERMPQPREESVHLARFPEAETPDEALLARWAKLIEIRTVVTKALEETRAAKEIASSLEAAVTLTAPDDALQLLKDYDAPSRSAPGRLANLFIVSAVTLAPGGEKLTVAVARAQGGKCARCWTISDKVGTLAVHASVCERCAAVLEAAR